MTEKVDNQELLEDVIEPCDCQNDPAYHDDFFNSHGSCRMCYFL